MKRRFKQLVAMFPGAVPVRRAVARRLSHLRRVPVERPRDRGPSPLDEVKKVSVSSEAVGQAGTGDQFVLYRVIGNDLVPRHRRGQSRENLRFILENEPSFPACEKRFIVNRISDPEEERAILTLIETAGFRYLHIPFDPREYADCVWDVSGVPLRYAPYTRGFRALTESQRGRLLSRIDRHKNNYIINNNGARNAALEDGRTHARWVLPWDGNCFLTEEAWEEIRAGIASHKEVTYWLVPMARITDNNRLLEEGFRPPAEEEPQVIFRSDALQTFDEAYYYGRRPKVELFWRLGVPGHWDDWPIEPWDLQCPAFADNGEQVGRVGWVARLFSGHSALEENSQGQALVERGLARVEAIRGLIDRLDQKILGPQLNQARPVFTSRAEIVDAGPSVQTALRRAADEALERGPYSVVDKQTLPPSENPHDYWHPAPYYWPNPLRIPGLPYVPRDGKRVPGTRLYEPLSDRYDRTRLQRLFDDTYALALGSVAFGSEEYGHHAAWLVRTWFIDPATAMTPHMTYAQVRRGHERNRGSSSGIIEMKDLYYFLDAVRLLEEDGYIPSADSEEFRFWLNDYLEWLRTNPQGQEERAAPNNHGTYFDLQIGSIAAFLGDYLLLRDTLRDSRFRIIQQFERDGRQPHEMSRTTTAHYCCFNLQGWVHLADLAASVGEDLWGFEGAQGQGLRPALEWLLGHMGHNWPYEQIDAFDSDRFYPLLFAYQRQFGSRSDWSEAAAPKDVKPLFFPHDGIRPFWQIGWQCSTGLS